MKLTLKNRLHQFQKIINNDVFFFHQNSYPVGVLVGDGILANGDF